MLRSVYVSQKYISGSSAYSDFCICCTRDIFAMLMGVNLRPVWSILLMMYIIPSLMGQDQLPDTSGKRVITPKSSQSIFDAEPSPSVYGQFVGGMISSDNIFHAAAPVQKIPVLVRRVENRDWIFYFYCGTLVFLSFIQLAFDKYFLDLFRVFFNTSLRQKQIREQLSQAPLPSLLMNILFFISGGIFLYFLKEHYGLKSGYPKALEIIIAISGLGIIYVVKCLFISLLGWVFDKRDASESYLFNVFMVNKIAGLILLPMGILLAYADGGWKNVIVTLTFIFLTILVVMRVIRCFTSVAGLLKINLLHFLVFAGAFEVIPLMVLYRLLLRVIE